MDRSPVSTALGSIEEASGVATSFDGYGGAGDGFAVWTVGVVAFEAAAGAEAAADPLADADEADELAALWDFPPPQAASPSPSTRTAGRISNRVRDTCRSVRPPRRAAAPSAATEFGSTPLPI